MCLPEPVPGFDFTDPDIYAERLPVDELAELRRTAPIWWNNQPIGKGGFNDGGFWVVTRHKDVKEVSLRSDVFSTYQNTALPRYPRRREAGEHRRGACVDTQYRRTASHPAAQDHLARIHSAGRRTTAR